MGGTNELIKERMTYLNEPAQMDGKTLTGRDKKKKRKGQSLLKVTKNKKMWGAMIVHIPMAHKRIRNKKTLIFFFTIFCK